MNGRAKPPWKNRKQTDGVNLLKITQVVVRHVGRKKVLSYKKIGSLPEKKCWGVLFNGVKNTLDNLIIVGVRLLIFWQFSSHYPLIPYPTFINFAPNVHPIPAKIQFLDKITQTMPLTSLNVSTFFKNFHPIRLFNTLRLLIHQ